MKRSPSGPHSDKTILPNGVRVLSETLSHVDSVSLGVWVNSGTVDDPAASNGLAHLIEHMLFKGTHTRTNRRIAETIDDIGGNVNGITDREFMYLFARTTADHLETALTLLVDMLLNSICSTRNLTKEIEVVLQEIRAIDDAPEDWVHDLLLEQVWPGHPLGQPVIGKAESIARVTCPSLRQHLARMHAGRNVIITAAGQINHQWLVEKVGRLTTDLLPGSPFPLPDAPVFTPGRFLVKRPTHQVHFCLTTQACDRTAPERHIYSLLDTILGGGTSSRLFHEIREKRGLAYNIGSYLQLYRNAGLFTIDAGTNPDQFELVLELVAKEMARLRRRGPTAAELERAKTQTRVALALAAESTHFRMQHLAISEICWGRTLAFEEIAAGVTAVTAEDVHVLAQRVCDPERQALVAIGPFGKKGKIR